MNKDDLKRAIILSQGIDRISEQIKSLKEREPQKIAVYPNNMVFAMDKSIVNTVATIITASLESKLKEMEEELKRIRRGQP